MSIRWWSSIVVVFGGLFVLGCTSPAYVQVIRYPDAASPEPNCSALRVIERDAPAPAGCEAFGDVFVGDSGSTHPCKPEDLRKQAEEQACKEGASAMQIVHVRPPVTGSSCHQMRASLLHCAAAESGETE